MVQHLWVFNQVGFFFARGDAGSPLGKELVMLTHWTPFLANYIWIGGGTIGLIVVIVIVVLLLRR